YSDPPDLPSFPTRRSSDLQNLIRDAIKYETSRGGLVFFIHNRVQTIDEIAAMIRAIVPDTRIGVAHGQMKPAELEKVMLNFVERSEEHTSELQSRENLVCR